MLAQYINRLSSHRILLASGSPRRKKILQELGVNFEVYPSDFSENLDFHSFDTPADFVIETAKQKALSVAKDIEIRGQPTPHLIIAADTVVVFKNEVIGKPNGKDGAKEILRKLSGQIHSVFSGVAFILYDKDAPACGASYEIRGLYDETEVKMAPLTSKIIDSYVETGEPMDKAGAYAIQGLGSTFIEGIKGDFYNVIGLPVFKVTKMLCSMIDENSL